MVFGRSFVGLSVFVGAAWAAGACGGATYADKCELACQAPADGPCAADGDVEACQSACETTLEGLSTYCAQCIVEHSGWSGVRCVDGCRAAFGPGGVGSGDCEPCTDADEHCSDFDLEKTTSSSCKDTCIPEG